jgi:hypothetical protein
MADINNDDDFKQYNPVLNLERRMNETLLIGIIQMVILCLHHHLMKMGILAWLMWWLVLQKLQILWKSQRAMIILES